MKAPRNAELKNTEMTPKEKVSGDIVPCGRPWLDLQTSYAAIAAANYESLAELITSVSICSKNELNIWVCQYNGVHFALSVQCYYAFCINISKLNFKINFKTKVSHEFNFNYAQIFKYFP